MSNQHSHEGGRFQVISCLMTEHPAEHRVDVMVTIENHMGRTVFTFDDGLELDFDTTELRCALPMSDAGRLRAA